MPFPTNTEGKLVLAYHRMSFFQYVFLSCIRLSFILYVVL